jgi:uroporphyrinogen III methyltransferase/synthase
MTVGRPLDGRTVVVTRAAEQAGRFVALLEEAGARILQTPAIVIAPPASWAPLDAALAELGRFTWIIFTSVNGVSMVDRRLGDLGLSWSMLAGARVAAIGPATAAALERYGVRVAVVPEEYLAEGLVGRLRGMVGIADRVLLPRAAQTRDVLVTELRRLGAEVTEVAAYQTRAAEVGTDTLRSALAGSGVDVVTFTSSSTARNFALLFTEEERRQWFAGLTVASIGPVTAATAAEYGLVTTVMPSMYTIPALARAIAEHFAAPTAQGRAAGRRGAGAPPSEASL